MHVAQSQLIIISIQFVFPKLIKSQKYFWYTYYSSSCNMLMYMQLNRTAHPFVFLTEREKNPRLTEREKNR